MFDEDRMCDDYSPKLYKQKEDCKSSNIFDDNIDKKSMDLLHAHVQI